MARNFLDGRVQAAKLIGDLGEVMAELPAAVQEANERTAEEAASDAQARAVDLGGVHGHVADGITSSGGTIQLDADKQPAILGAEFGAIRYRQFPRWLGSDDGYMLAPELEGDDVVERYGEFLDDLLED